MPKETLIQEKQVVYVNFMPRLFSTIIDLYLILIISFYPIRFIGKRLFLYIFKDDIILKNINLNDIDVMEKFQLSYDFNESPSSLLLNIAIMLLINFIFVSVYFVFFWSKFGTTPAKYIFGIKVLDLNTMGNLSIVSSIKRILASTLSLIGIWFIFFSKKKQALHDKIASSIVVKR